MSDSNSSALVASSSTTGKRSLNRQKILEEDEYTRALEHIIARDFYPSLVHLDATNEYLDAVESEDANRIGASIRRLEEISDTPRNYLGDTPLPRTSSGQPARKRARHNEQEGSYDTSLKLDQFQARYTSEDNASFTEILDGENQRRKEVYGWAYDAERRVKEKQLKIEQGRERMLIEAGGSQESHPGVRQRLVIEQPQPKGLITNGSEEKEGDESGGAIVLRKKEEDDEEDGPVDVMAPKKDTRVASVDGWNFKTRNALMFGPGANESPYNTSSGDSTESNPPIVLYGNTRLDGQDEGQSDAGTSVPPSPSRSRIDAAITNTPYRRKEDSLHGLVPNMPSPTPAEIGEKGVKQLMTLGTLSATPRIISTEDEPATPFRIPQPSSREALSHRLANDAKKSLRSKANLLSGVKGTPKRQLGDMAPPSWTPRKTAGSLTPAARHLLERSTSGGRRGNVMGGGSRKGDRREQDLGNVRWTPTPGRT